MRGSLLMPEFLKYLGAKLRRSYDRIVEKPLPWSMIDKLATLDERAEAGGAGSADIVPREASAGDLAQPSPQPNDKPKA